LILNTVFVVGEINMIILDPVQIIDFDVDSVCALCTNVNITHESNAIVFHYNMTLLAIVNLLQIVLPAYISTMGVIATSNVTS